MAFEEGKHGRGPTPYSTSMSRKPAGFRSHSGESGRGAPGIHGEPEGRGAMSGDVEHPQSHAGFEALGVGGTEE